MKSYFDELWKNKVKLLLKEFMNLFFYMVDDYRAKMKLYGKLNFRKI